MFHNFASYTVTISSSENADLIELYFGIKNER